MDHRVSAHELQSILDELQPFPCWAARRGHGTFLNFEFGERKLMQTKSGPMEFGDIHLWVYLSRWQIDVSDLHVDWDSPVDQLLRSLDHFVGLPLTKIDRKPAVVGFGLSGQTRITMRPHGDVKRSAHLFKLFLPGHRVLSCTQHGIIHMGDSREP